MRIGELEKRMDYKFEERMRRIEAVEEQFREKSKDHNELLPRREYGSTMLVSAITNTIYVNNGNSCPGSGIRQSILQHSGRIKCSNPWNGRWQESRVSFTACLPSFIMYFFKASDAGNNSPKCFLQACERSSERTARPGGRAPNSELERLHQIPDIPCQQGCCGDLRSAEYRTTPSKQSEPPTGSLRMTPATARSTSRPKAGVGPHGIRGSEAGRCPGKIGRGG